MESIAITGVETIQWKTGET